MSTVLSVDDIAQLNITTRLLVEEALVRGYKISGFMSTPSSKSSTIECSKPGIKFQFKSLCTSLTSSYGVFAAEDKVLTHNLLKAKSVPMPEMIVLTEGASPDEAEAFMKQYGPVVVKPVDANHGDGVSMNVKSRDDLEIAVKHARNLCGKQPDIIVQQQISGDEYRFLVLGDKVLAVATRRPASVIGDGSSTVRELIDSKNADPRRGVGHKSELTRISIEDVKHHNKDSFLEYIPKPGELCFVLHTSNLSKGGDSIDVTDHVSKALKRMAVKAAKASFLGVAGVDIITNDITTSDLSQSYVIEVNVSPGIRMHQFPAEGRARNVAKTLFSAIEARAIRDNKKEAGIIGVSSHLDFVGYKMFKKIPVRVDTGARTSSLWASDIKVKKGIATFKLFGEGSPFYTGKVVKCSVIELRVVTNSTGHAQERYVVSMPIRMHGKRLNAKFTLSDRSTQTYPILIGRNTLRGNFYVDSGDPGEAMVYKYPEEAAEFNESELML